MWYRRLTFWATLYSIHKTVTTCAHDGSINEAKFFWSCACQFHAEGRGQSFKEGAQTERMRLMNAISCWGWREIKAPQKSSNLLRRTAFAVTYFAQCAETASCNVCTILMYDITNFISKVLRFFVSSEMTSLLVNYGTCFYFVGFPQLRKKRGRLPI